MTVCTSVHQLWIYSSPIADEEGFIVCMYVLEEDFPSSSFVNLRDVDVERTTGLAGERLVQLKIRIRNCDDAVVEELRSCLGTVKDLRIGFLKEDEDFSPILRLLDGVTVEKVVNHSLSKELSARLMSDLSKVSFISDVMNE